MDDNKNYKNNKYLDGHHFTNKNGEKWYFISKNNKNKSFAMLVIGYLESEYDFYTHKMSTASLTSLINQIDNCEDGGINVPNTAAFIMETFWQNGLKRPDTN